MAEITAAAVKALREKTGLPLMDCKKALTESGGDNEAAITWLRERGIKVMGGKMDRETAFGRSDCTRVWIKQPAPSSN